MPHALPIDSTPIAGFFDHVLEMDHFIGAGRCDQIIPVRRRIVWFRRPSTSVGLRNGVYAGNIKHPRMKRDLECAGDGILDVRGCKLSIVDPPPRSPIQNRKGGRLDTNIEMRAGRPEANRA